MLSGCNSNHLIKKSESSDGLGFYQSLFVEKIDN